MRKKILKSRWAVASLFATLAAATLLGAQAWHDTRADPLVRTVEVPLQGLPKSAPPLRIVLISDVHVAGPDMPPSRLSRIVRQINTLNPDIVLLAGDLTSDKRTATRIYSTEESAAPLAGLKARYGKVAVPGNHDYQRGIDDVRTALEQVDFVVLQNDARKVGPVVVGGLDDDFTGHAALATTLRAMDALPGPQILLSHSPDPFATLKPGHMLMLAGHTHCGQIAYPWGGSPATMSRYGQRYACGVVRENGNTLVVSAGLGTSLLPIRLFASPDLWAIKAKPPGP